MFSANSEGAAIGIAILACRSQVEMAGLEVEDAVNGKGEALPLTDIASVSSQFAFWGSGFTLAAEGGWLNPWVPF